ncbi:hypothetical protein EK904_009730 [Melospiza melodia maxima]|nr:hypothetical protein EK904_009730 [Melospiza melodia maxima]
MIVALSPIAVGFLPFSFWGQILVQVDCNMFGNNKLSGFALRGGFMLLIINANHSKWTNKTLKNALFVQNASVKWVLFFSSKKADNFFIAKPTCLRKAEMKPSRYFVLNQLFCQHYTEHAQCSRASLYLKEEAENILLIIQPISSLDRISLMQKRYLVAFITSKLDYSNSVFSNLPDEPTLHPQMPLKTSAGNRDNALPKDSHTMSGSLHKVLERTPLILYTLKLCGFTVQQSHSREKTDKSGGISELNITSLTAAHSLEKALSFSDEKNDVSCTQQKSRTAQEKNKAKSTFPSAVPFPQCFPEANEHCSHYCVTIAASSPLETQVPFVKRKGPLQSVLGALDGSGSMAKGTAALQLWGQPLRAMKNKE